MSALADCAVVHLCIPEHLAIQLSLSELERREVVPGREVLKPQPQSIAVDPESPNIPLSVAT
jgi:hypothetical protein